MGPNDTTMRKSDNKKQAIGHTDIGVNINIKLKINMINMLKKVDKNREHHQKIRIYESIIKWKFQRERIMKSEDEFNCRLDTAKQKIRELKVVKQKILSLKCREKK